MPTSTGLSSCLPCVIVATGGPYLSLVFWYNSTVSLPLDTISVFLSDYRNTSITSTSIAYGNIDSFSGSVLSSQLSAVQSWMSEEGLSNGYGVFPSPILANSTDVTVPGGVTSFAYPTPYVGIAGFLLYTTLPSAGCVLDSEDSNGYFAYILQAPGALGPSPYFNDNGSLIINYTTAYMKSTFYTALDVGQTSNILDIFSDQTTPFDLDTKSFSEFIASDTSLLHLFPYLASCSIYPGGVGPPRFQLPVVALTATMRRQFKKSFHTPRKPRRLAIQRDLLFQLR